MKVEVKYQCQHITCRISRCHEGTIVLDKAKFDMYCQSSTEPGCFVSPSNVCKIGHSQIFKIIEKKTVDENVAHLPQRHEATIEEKKEIHKLAIEGEGPVEVMKIYQPELTPSLATVDQVTALEKKVKDLEARIEKIEGWKKGSKVSRKED